MHPMFTSHLLEPVHILYISFTLLEPVSALHILDGAIVATEAEELLPQLQHSQLLHHVPEKTLLS